MGLQTGRLIKAIRSAILVVVIVTFLTVALYMTLDLLFTTATGGIIIGSLLILSAFGVLVGCFYDIEA